MLRMITLLMCAGGLAVFIGCQGRYATTPVSGKITLNGQPLADATVTFTPEAVGTESPGSFGRTDANGNYTLELVVDGKPGAIVGKHKVRIAKNVQSESDVTTPQERAQAALPEHDFSFEVKSGSNEANFDLANK